jgi:hypothetical protein
MRRQLLGASALALTLSLSLGSGLAAANPSDGGRDGQLYAVADLSRQLDECVVAVPSAIYIAGDNTLKIPLNDGPPGSWSDLTVVMTMVDECAGTAYVVQGWAPFTDPDIVRFESASIADLLVQVTDETGEIEADVLVTLAWTAAGQPDDALRMIDLGRLSIRSEVSAPAAVVGSLVVTDEDGDIYPGGFTLDQNDVYHAALGMANEIDLAN